MPEPRLSRQAARAYKRLDAATRGRVDAVFEQMEAGGLDHPNVCALRGQLAGSWRWRLGAWRIVFRLDDEADVVWVEAITTRGGAYRKR